MGQQEVKPSTFDSPRFLWTVHAVERESCPVHGARIIVVARRIGEPAKDPKSGWIVDQFHQSAN